MIDFRGNASRDRVVELLQAMVAIDSVNLSLEGATHGERPMAEHLAGILTKLGLEVSLLEAAPGRPNLIARLSDGRSDRTLMFEGHLDTVTVVNMPDGHRPVVRDGRLYGRGACDTKGGIAAFVHALELLLPHRDRLEADLLFVGAVDEEVGFGGINAFVAQGGRADAAVIFEPTSLQPVVAHKGGVRIRIRTHGKSAHSARPELGDNAIYQMATVVQAIQQELEPALAKRHHSLCGSPTLVVSRISGGLAINIVPPECTIDIDRRTLPDEDPAAVAQEFEEFVTRLRQRQPQLQVSVEQVLMGYWGMDTPAEEPIVQRAVEACRMVTGRGEPLGVAYGTDASVLAVQAGVPCVVLGPGDIAQAHSSNEWVEIEQLAAAAEIYATIAMRY